MITNISKKDSVSNSSKAFAGQYIMKYRKTGDILHLREYYRREAYTGIYKRPKRKWLRKNCLITKLINVCDGEHVLDVGCASQLLRTNIEKSGGKYFGVDISAGFNPDVVCDVNQSFPFKDNPSVA
jgi:cyclopropane fatty-acyl-phospholipid synthase-like methyltransferase